MVCRQKRLLLSNKVEYGYVQAALKIRRIFRFEKPCFSQLQENKKVEASFWKPGEMFGTMMRVEGEVEFLEDIELKKKVLEDRPFLKDFGFTPESPDLVLFKITKGNSYFWSMETAFEPKKMIEFGKYDLRRSLNG